MSGRAVQVKIILLDGTSVDYDPGGVKRGSIKVKDVIKEAHRKAGMEGEYEEKFFSLYSYEHYVTEVTSNGNLKQKIFLDTRKPSRKLIDHFYSEEDRNNSIWTFRYGVKFYISRNEVEKELRTKKARWLYYLQLCDDIKENKIIMKCDTRNMDNCIILTSLLLRARQKSPEEHPLELIPKEKQPDDFNQKIDSAMIENVKISDMDPAKAVQEFIKFLFDCDSKYYGKHLFLARERLQQKHQDPGKLVIIANDRDGITIYDDEIQEQILWKNIVKISYRRNEFCIKRIEVEESESGESNARKHVKCMSLCFYCAGVKGRSQQAKWIWKNALEQHAFPRVEHLGSRVFHRRTTFRYSGPNTDKYVIEKKENETWKITYSPPDDLKVVRVDVIRPIAAGKVSSMRKFHFEIKQDKSGAYQLQENTEDSEFLVTGDTSRKATSTELVQ